MKRFKSIVAAALAVVIVGAYGLSALPASAASSSSLSIEPRKNYVIKPGKSVDDKLKITNLDNAHSLHLTLRVVDFTYSDDSGTAKFMLDPNAPETTWSLKPFLTIPQEVTVPAGQSKAVNMKVAIPAGHGAGSYYSAILYSAGSGSPGDGGNVGLSASTATLVFTNIPGKVNENLSLQKLGAYHEATASKQAGYSFITGDQPKMLAYTLKNAGNVVESPAGSMTLTNMFGQTTKIDNINPNSQLALIDQARTFTACIKQKDQKVNFGGSQTKSVECDSPGLWPGYYKVTLDAYYGQNGNKTQEVVGTASFWYLPMWFVFTVLVLLLIIGFFVWRFVRKVRGKMYGPSRGRSTVSRRR